MRNPLSTILSLILAVSVTLPLFSVVQSMIENIQDVSDIALAHITSV